MRSTRLLLVCFLVLAGQASCWGLGMVEQTKAVNDGEDSMEGDGDDFQSDHELRILDSAVNDGEDSMEDEDGDDLTEHIELRGRRGKSLKKAFQTLDKDGNNFLSKFELRQRRYVLPRIRFPPLSIFMRFRDTNKDGKISFKEFVVAVKKYSKRRRG